MRTQKFSARSRRSSPPLAERLKGASAGVFVDYKGITVDEDTKSRHRAASE